MNPAFRLKTLSLIFMACAFGSYVLFFNVIYERGPGGDHGMFLEQRVNTSATRLGSLPDEVMFSGHLSNRIPARKPPDISTRAQELKRHGWESRHRPNVCSTSTSSQDTEDEILKKLFPTATREHCEGSRDNLICLTKGILENPTFRCRQRICQAKSHSFGLGTFNDKTGEIDWIRVPSCRHLEVKIRNLMKFSNQQSHHGFCLITANHSNSQHTDGDLLQILLLPPQLHLFSTQAPRRSSPVTPDINLIMLDSLSRGHFYRSLPKTVEALARIKASELAGADSVLDFTQFQSVKPRTYETLRALFSGEILELMESDMFSLDDVPKGSIKASKLLLPLKKAGYRVLWVEDLCWSSDWGLGRYFGLNNTDRGGRDRNHLKIKLMLEGVDELGVSLANCEISRRLNYTDPFHSRSDLCMGKNSYQRYLFQYVTNYQRILSRKNVPYFSFLMSNIAHESSGVRVQQVDSALASFLSHSAHMENTITIILSDHGNTYGVYPENYIKGRVEIFNPLLLMIIPIGVKSKLADRGIDIEHLISNQKRLLTVLDLHFSLMSLLSPRPYPSTVRSWRRVNKRFKVNLNGLLQPISPNRSCADIPLMQPNLCICENFLVARESSSYHVLLGEFALGMLNRLLEEWKSSLPLLKDRSCPRLGSHRVSNVMESQSRDGLQITFDLHIHPWHGRQTPAEVLVVTVLLTDSSIRLVSYHRVTEYAKYSSCTPAQSDVRLCLCGRPEEPRVSELPALQRVVRSSEMFGKVAQHRVIERENGQASLVIIVRRHQAGAAFEVVNLSPKRSYSISFHLNVSNMMISDSTPLQKRVRPEQIKFLAVVVQKVTHLRWEWSFEVDHTLENSDF